MNRSRIIWFFAGGDHGKGALNLFTGSFIRMMEERFGKDFRIINGIYNRFPFLNVVWGLTHAQSPISARSANRILNIACGQVLETPPVKGSSLYIVSSSYGSVVAAQTACCLATRIENGSLEPFALHVALGASMVSKESALYRKLSGYLQKGIISQLVYDPLQDEGDNSAGIGGTTRIGAYLRGLGICFPFLTFTYKGPSFLNKHPQKGHLHRKRAQSLEKAEDFMRVMDGFIRDA